MTSLPCAKCGGVEYHKRPDCVTDAGSRLGPDAPHLHEAVRVARLVIATARNGQIDFNWHRAAVQAETLLEAVARGTVPGEPTEVTARSIVVSAKLDGLALLMRRLKADVNRAAVVHDDRFVAAIRETTQEIWNELVDAGAARGEASESRSVPPRCGFWGELERRCVRPDGHAGDHFLGEREPFDVGESRSVGASEIPVIRPWGNDVRGWLRTQLTYVLPLIERAWTARTAEDFEAAIWAALDGVRAGEPK